MQIKNRQRTLAWAKSRTENATKKQVAWAGDLARTLCLQEEKAPDGIMSGDWTTNLAGGAGSRPRHEEQAEAHTGYKPDEWNGKLEEQKSEEYQAEKHGF
jgi:hypothetical protein